MIIHIHDNLLVSEVQERFSKCFQSLRLEFYNKRYSQQDSCNDDSRIDPSRHIGEIRRKYREGSLDVKSWFTVHQLLTDLKEKFGLNTMVFRNESGKWVSASKTDHFTIAQQQELSHNTTKKAVSRYSERESGYAGL
jgi:hypothetical protein